MIVPAGSVGVVAAAEKYVMYITICKGKLKTSNL